MSGKHQNRAHDWHEKLRKERKRLRMAKRIARRKAAMEPRAGR
jgi:hypothetical protein